MRKLILLILILLLSAAPAFAIDRTLTLLSGATATGEGTAQWVKDTTVNNWTCDVDITGTPTAVTVRIEGNMGGTAFDPIGMGTHAITFANHSTTIKAGKATFGIVYSPVKNIRANVIVLTGGSSPTVSVVCGGNPI